MLRTRGCALIVPALITIVGGVGRAQNTNPTTPAQQAGAQPAASGATAPAVVTPPAPRVVGVSPVKAGLGDVLTVHVEGLAAAAKANAVDLSSLTLYLDGRAILDAAPEIALVPHDSVRFRLERTDESRDAWSKLLGSPQFGKPTRPVVVSVGPKNAVPFAAKSGTPMLRLIIYRSGFATVGLILLPIVALGYWYFLYKSEVIRDSNPPKPAKGEERPYSLARLQMAIWFFLVVVAYLFIWLITWDHNTITNTALVLIGIGTGTLLGSKTIDDSKSDSAREKIGKLTPERAKLKGDIAKAAKAKDVAATDVEKAAQDTIIAKTEAELEELERKLAEEASKLTKPVSERFDKDIMTDVDGVSFHRFQMLVWTCVLGAIFVVEVYRNLSMPAFSATLLALQGISAGTYLGFKSQERQTEAAAPAPPATPAAPAVP